MSLIGYLWALPVTAIGLFFACAAASSGGSVRFRDGVVEVVGGVVGWVLRGNRFWQGGAAMTLGHVILTRDFECLERSRAHELCHVRQFERWGPLLLPAYWVIGAWFWFRGCHAYLDHPFEPPPG